VKVSFEDVDGLICIIGIARSDVADEEASSFPHLWILLENGSIDTCAERARAFGYGVRGRLLWVSVWRRVLHVWCVVGHECFSVDEGNDVKFGKTRTRGLLFVLKQFEGLI